MQPHRPWQHVIDRRTFLVASGLGVTGYAFGRAAAAVPGDTVPVRQHPARSTILFFLCGGASHIDTWDMKPQAPLEYRGVFRPTATSAIGVRLCEHLPLLARQAHHLAIVNSLGHYGRGTGDHHAGYYYNLTGHAPDPSFVTLGNNRRPYPDDWPYMGAVVGARRPAHATLANAITLPHKPSQLPYTRPGQFAARLGVQYEPLYVQGSLAQPLEFRAPAVELQAGMTPAHLADRRNLLGALDGLRADLDEAPLQSFGQQQDRAMSLLLSAQMTQAFDVAREPVALRERYGNTVNGTSLLLARRLVEIGVPFVTVFWMENPALAARCQSAGGWDTHGNNFNCLRDHLLPEFDRGFSALIEDLHQRSLLEQTLLLVTSEMGRKPRIGDPRSGGVGGAGRDHWTSCMSVLLAGGGVRGGQHYGTSDARAEFPDRNPVAPEDITKTVYHAMGVTDLEARDTQGRPYNLLAEGAPIAELF